MPHPIDQPVIEHDCTSQHAHAPAGLRLSSASTSARSPSSSVEFDQLIRICQRGGIFEREHELSFHSRLMLHVLSRLQEKLCDKTFRERARFAAYALYRRASEATTPRTHLDGLLAGSGQTAPVILLGDMNDEPDAATTLILNGPPGSEIGSVGFDRPDQGDGDRMWNTGSLIPEPQRFTRLYRGRMELIDHIFVSHFLAPAPARSRSPP
jgi:hypothetical protein